MNKARYQIALLTPVKNELENLPKFFEKIANLSTSIYSLTIIENNSDDGSKEFLRNIKNPKNIENFHLIENDFKDASYDLEFKYAKIIDIGLKSLQSMSFYDKVNFIGILDSDVFPEEDYYSKLVTFLRTNESIGLTSGLIYTEEGKLHMSNKKWVRGGSRLWKKECLEDTGFPIAPSPDAITVALAHINGWQAISLKTAKVYSREVGIRMNNFKTFGSRAYYRGNTAFFAILKTFDFILIKWKPKIGFDFFTGYFTDYFKGNAKIEINEVRNYYKYYLINKLIKKY